MTNLVPVGNEEHRFLVAEQLREIGAAARLHLLEPEGRNTASAVAAAAAALLASQGDATLLVLPSDHLVSGADRFHEAVSTAARLARTGELVTFGVKPTEPASGYGYIRRGSPCEGFATAYHVAEFIEKPALERAKQCPDGNCEWNSGMFVFGARRYLEELEKFRPEIRSAAERAVRKGRPDLDFLRLDKNEFAGCPADSIDYTVMEKMRDACVVAAGFS